MIRALAACGLALAACGKGAGTGGHGTIRDGLYYVEPGAPDPLACKRDDDCVADVVTRDAAGCCMVNNPYAQTRAWRDWMMARRRTGVCDHVRCDEGLQMAPPPTCATQVRCVVGRCQDACGAAQPFSGE